MTEKEKTEKVQNDKKVEENVTESPKVEVVKSKEEEYLDRLQRLQAEFENYRRRSEKEKMENMNNANANLISHMLDVLDHFELSLKHNKDKGIALIYDELVKILQKQGLKVIETKGKFDPKIHEAVVNVEGKEEGLILEEIQKGYLLNNKLLRASKVKISKVMEKK